MNDAKDAQAEVAAPGDGMEVRMSEADAAEVRAVRAGGGHTQLAGWDTFRFTGRDALRFVHGMVSNDVQGLADGAGNHTCVLTNKGKILADLFLYRQGKDLNGFCLPGRGRVIVETLERYIIADRLTPELTTGSRTLFGFYGAPGIALARSLPSASTETDAATADGMGSFAVELEGAEADLFLAPGAPGVQAVLSVPAEIGASVGRLIAERAAAAGVTAYGEAALRCLSLEDGRPWYGIDLDDGNFPDEAALSHTVHYKKGCYIGQETIARIHYLGHVNRHLVGLLPETPVNAGDVIRHGEKEVGRITRGAVSPTLAVPIALGYVKRELADAGTEIRVATAAGEIGAAVATLPFVR